MLLPCRSYADADKAFMSSVVAAILNRKEKRNNKPVRINYDLPHWHESLMNIHSTAKPALRMRHPDETETRP